MAVFERHICPDDVRDHLCLNAAGPTTCDKMKDEIAGVLLARQGRSATDADSSEPSPMDIGWIGWKGKGDKGKKAKAKATRRTEKRRTSLPTRARVRSATGADKGATRRSTNKSSVNSVEDGKEKGETLAFDWVLAIVGERGETPIMDSGAVCSTCPPGFAPLATLEDAAGERPLRAANGLDLENFGMEVVKQEVKLASGKPTQVLTKYRAANVQRPIISLSEAVNGGNVGFFSKDFSGIARPCDIEIVVKGDYIPLKLKGGLFEMGVLDATQEDGRVWAKSRGTVAAVTDGGSAEARDTVDKRLEITCKRDLKALDAEMEVSEEVIDGEAVEPSKRKVATTPSSPTEKSPGTT